MKPPEDKGDNIASTAKGGAVDKEAFVEMFEAAVDARKEASPGADSLEMYKEAKSKMIGMLGISCEGDVKEQREAILSVLGQTEGKGKIDLESFIS